MEARGIKVGLHALHGGVQTPTDSIAFGWLNKYCII